MERLVSIASTDSRMEPGKALIIALLLLTGSCINHNADTATKSQYFDAPETELSIEYARGFEIRYQPPYTLILTKSIEGNTPFRDSIFLLHKETSNLPADAKILRNSNLNLACQSSTHLGFLQQLNMLHQVTGVCGLQYIQNKELAATLSQNGTQDICQGESLKMETLLKVHPDLYLIYPFSSEERENIENSGVKTLMIGEYLETDPLARLEWIKLFGVILNRAEEAQHYFDAVESQYVTQKKSHSNKDRLFFMNLPFGDAWHSPSPSSLIVEMCEDAGLRYYFQEETGTENVIHAQEVMWKMGHEIPYWVIIASRPNDFSLSDLKTEEPVYSTFRSVKEGKVIICNTGSSDYFTYGVTEPHIMLQELIAAIGGEYLEDARYFKILK